MTRQSSEKKLKTDKKIYGMSPYNENKKSPLVMEDLS
jgi:hypothetical protein